MHKHAKSRLGQKPDNAWVATPFSQRPYYPFALANGSDCVTIDYTGSMFSGMNGHAHKEQHQGLIPGWYKAAHRIYHVRPGKSGLVQPVIQAGYNICVDGEIGDPELYTQSFDARRAVLTTDITLADVSWRVTTYLADAHLWVERIQILRVPRDKRIDLVFFIRPKTGSVLHGLTLHRESLLKIKPGKGYLEFDYTLTPNNVHGTGTMWAAPRGTVRGNEIRYMNVQRGFVATRYLLAVDDAETPQWRSEARSGYTRLRSWPEVRIRRAHETGWDDYSRQSSITVPDSVCQGLYDLSMYWMRANQYPQTGSMNLGPLPCHWGGGCNAIPDAWSMQMALLTGNHPRESRRLLDFYRQRVPRARFVAKALGLPGARLTYFSTAGGQDAHADPERVRTEKIGANAMACYSFYDHWLLTGRDDGVREDMGVMRELLDHVLAVAVIEKPDCAYIGETKPSDEGAQNVSNDSIISVWTARALKGYCEMAAAAGEPVPAHYARIASKLPLGLRDNYRNGILMPFKNANHYGGDAVLCCLWNLPGGLDRKSVLHSIKVSRTPWGGNSDYYTEKYRNWPWSQLWPSILFSHWGWSKEAFTQLALSMKECSALGAIPEKIRMDGYAIGYWYTSVHAYYLMAVQAGLCHDRPHDAIGLLQGMDGTWRDIEFNRLRMKGGLLVSLKVAKGRVCRLILHNDGDRSVQRKLIWNPRYAGTPIKDVSLRPGQTIKAD